MSRFTTTDAEFTFRVSGVDEMPPVTPYRSVMVHVIKYDEKITDAKPGDYCVRLTKHQYGVPTVYFCDTESTWQLTGRHPLGSAIERGQLSAPGTTLVVISA